MFARSLHLGRLAGIAVRLDSSLLLFAVLVAWVFGASFLQRHALVTATFMAVVATALFLASVLAHELAHGLEARYRGIRVHGVTLFFFGGMTEMHVGSRTPRDEFAVSAVGPYASLVCGAVFGLAAAFAPLLGGGLASPVGDVAGLLAWLNVFLAAFNLVPGAPLDGGRVLRAALWWLLDDRHRAARLAARSGQALAVALVAAGLWLVAAGFGWGLPGGADARATDWGALAGSQVFGVMLVLVGGFIFQAARAELAQDEVDQLLEQRPVQDLLDGPVPLLEAERPLDLVDPGPTDRLLPVLRDGTIVGLVPAGRIRDLHPTDRAARTAGEVMEPVDDLPHLDRDARLRELVDHLLGETDAVVIDGEGYPVAVLREWEVARGLERLRRRRGRRRAPAGRAGARR